MSREFLEEGGPKNADLAWKILPYTEALLIGLQIVRVLFLLAAFKWMQVTKCTFYLETMIQVVTMLMPLKVSLPREITYQQMMMYMTFWLTYFNFWTDATFAIISLIPVYISQSIFYELETVPLLINFVLMIPSFSVNLLFVHLVITKLGFLYVDNAVLRSGNEQLLDNLEEGVIIIEETSRDILYYNEAATGHRHK